MWRPGVDQLEDGEELVYDPSTYEYLHAFTMKWPCLSFDFLSDELGDRRSTFPETVTLIAGSQVREHSKIIRSRRLLLLVLVCSFL